MVLQDQLLWRSFVVVQCFYCYMLCYYRGAVCAFKHFIQHNVHLTLSLHFNGRFFQVNLG